MSDWVDSVIYKPDAEPHFTMTRKTAPKIKEELISIKELIFHLQASIKPGTDQRSPLLGRAPHRSPPVGLPDLSHVPRSEMIQVLNKIIQVVQPNYPSCATAIIVHPKSITQWARDSMSYNASAVPTVAVAQSWGGATSERCVWGQSGPGGAVTWGKVNRGQHVDIPIHGGGHGLS
eukprot:m.22351 g.22351  ORF g.22351 m.22351 type:complete len:176 (-) comp5801_c0_seq1:98-625(-)